MDVYTDEVLKDFWARSFALRLREDFSDLFNMAEYTANGITNIEGTPKGGDQNVNALLYKFLARKVLNKNLNLDVPIKIVNFLSFFKRKNCLI